MQANDSTGLKAFWAVLISLAQKRGLLSRRADFLSGRLNSGELSDSYQGTPSGVPSLRE